MYSGSVILSYFIIRSTIMKTLTNIPAQFVQEQCQQYTVSCSSILLLDPSGDKLILYNFFKHLTASGLFVIDKQALNYFWAPFDLISKWTKALHKLLDTALNPTY